MTGARRTRQMGGRGAVTCMLRAWTPSRCVSACLLVCSTAVVPSGSSRSHLCFTSACLLASADRLALMGSLLRAMPRHAGGTRSLHC